MDGYRKTAESPPESGSADEDLIDTLIAISVVAKRLAEKLRKQKDKAVRGSGQETEETG